MKNLAWNEDKNEQLKAERGVCFEDVETAINEDKVLEKSSHPNQTKYPNQQIYVLEINGYAYIVPYVEDEEKIFLKTIIPSRRATKKYLIKP